MALSSLSSRRPRMQDLQTGHAQGDWPPGHFRRAATDRCWVRRETPQGCKKIQTRARSPAPAKVTRATGNRAAAAQNAAGGTGKSGLEDSGLGGWRCFVMWT